MVKRILIFIGLTLILCDGGKVLIADENNEVLGDRIGSHLEL
ncbi:MAG: hypothetical protein AB1422_19305 [bacterium]